MTRQAVTYVIGVDLGREVNHSAFAVAAVRPNVIEFIHLERVPLHTGYLRVLAKLRRLVKKLVAHKPNRIEIVCDAAGPGQVAIELLERRYPNLTITPVTITSGNTPGISTTGGLTVPRLTLLANLADMLKKNLLTVSTASKHRASWVDEVSAARNDGTQKQHDDLAIATALSAWQARMTENKEIEK